MELAATQKRVTPVIFLLATVLHAAVPTTVTGWFFAFCGVFGSLGLGLAKLLAQVQPGDLADAIDNGSKWVAGTGIAGAVAVCFKIAAPLIDKQLSESRAAKLDRIREENKHKLAVAKIDARQVERNAERIDLLVDWGRKAREKCPDLPHLPDELESDFGRERV